MLLPADTSFQDNSVLLLPSFTTFSLKVYRSKPQIRYPIVIPAAVAVKVVATRIRVRSLSNLLIYPFKLSNDSDDSCNCLCNIVTKVVNSSDVFNASVEAINKAFILV